MARTTTPQTELALSAALADLPARPRVHQLAKRSGRSSREVLAALAERGVPVASASSAVDQTVATELLTAWLSVAATAGATAGAVAAADPTSTDPVPAVDTLAQPDLTSAAEPAPAGPARAPRRRRGRAAAGEPDRADTSAGGGDDRTAISGPDQPVLSLAESDATTGPDPAAGGLMFLAPAPAGRSVGRSRRGTKRTATVDAEADETAESATPAESVPPPDHADPAAADPAAADPAENDETDTDETDAGGRRRRRRGRRGRSRAGGEQDDQSGDHDDGPDDQAGSGPGAPDSDPVGGSDDGEDDADADAGAGSEVDIDSDDAGGATRRRRRRRRRASGDDPAEDTESRGGRGGSADQADIPTVVHVRESRPAGGSSGEVQGLRGSTRLEAKRQRRRDSRDTRKRPQILSEAEFLARREAVDRVMAVRQRGPLAQVALLEDDVLVEHFVSRAGSQSLMGTIFLGRVQNVLPSMEAAFLDIGRGRNGVLYAGEVNWDAAGLAGKARRIETALRPGDAMLVQVSKDPVGQKGARLTTQISLPGRFLVYVPGGGATGISRKLPDTERKRLKSILGRIVPDDAGVIIRTAAEGAPEEELILDVQRLQAQWEEISQAAADVGAAPVQLSTEPDTLTKVVRDLFNSDISRLVIDGPDAFASISEYVEAVAPELTDRVSRYDGDRDVFAAYRIDEQIAKALERKVHLPSGGSLVIDRTEAMTVVDVNTGKFTGSGGNLEETVTRNNLEAAEEIVRQLRLRDIGGIIVVDVIDMVLESNRELVTRRLTECLGRDRTRHQVAEVTSLGLVQMTRKKMGTGLIEAFSEPCSHCGGRGIVLHDMPVEKAAPDESGDDDRRHGRGRRTRARTEPAEPIEVRRVDAAAVRPPDPRGPRPPARPDGAAGSHESVEPLSSAELATAAEAASAGRTATLPDLDPTAAAAGAGEPGSGDQRADASAEIGQLQGELQVAVEASAAVTAVLAALDARVAAGAEQVDEYPDGTAGGTDPMGEPAEPARPAARRRGRRSAGRAAGAPAPGANTPGGSDPAAETDGADPALAVVGSGVAPIAALLPTVATDEPAVGSGDAPVAALLPTVATDEAAPPARPRRRRAASRPAGPATAPVG